MINSLSNEDQRGLRRPRPLPAVAWATFRTIGPAQCGRWQTRQTNWPLSYLEAEVAGLRQLLAEVTANRDELRQEIDGLRRDRDHWQKLAEKARPTPPASGGDGGPGFAGEPPQAIKPDLLTR